MSISKPRVRSTLATVALCSASLIALCWSGTAAAQAASAAATTNSNPGATSAAPANNSTLSEVVVTATRRGDQNLLAVPLAVDAYSGKTLEKYNVQSLADISTIDPSLVVQSEGATQQTIVIRGISSPIGQTTGIYLDEAPLQGGFNGDIFGDGSPGLRMHDIDHIEVLKGPQGTLFGAGSMDGTLRIQSAKPKLDAYQAMVEGSAAGVQSGNSYYDGDAMVNVPILKDMLALRAVVWGENGGGFVDEYINGERHANVNDEHLLGGRVSLLFKPIDRFSLLATWNHQEAKVDGADYWTQSVGVIAAGGSRSGPYPAYSYESPSEAPYKDLYNLLTLTGQYDLRFGSVVATTSYGRKNSLQPNDSTATGCIYGFCAGTANYPTSYIPEMNFTDWTDEIRFSSNFHGPLQIVAGAYFEQDKTDFNSAAINDDNADGVIPCYGYAACHAQGLAQPGRGNSRIEFASEDKFNVQQYAVYAQGDFKILPNLTATFGARYFAADLHDTEFSLQDIAYDETPYGLDPGYVAGVITKPYVSSSDGAHESKPTYNASLLWQMNHNLSFYVRAASGFRIGGVNASEVLAQEANVTVPTSYQPDSLWDYEGGAKIYLLDRKLYLDASIFHIDWDNEQLQAEAAGTFNYTINAGKTTTDGGELDFSYQPMPELSLGGGLTYVNAELADDLPADVVAAGTPGKAGDRVPLVPHLSFSGYGEYDHDFGDSLTGYLQTNFNYRGDSYTQFENTSSDYDAKLKSYFLLNLRAGVRFGGYDISLYVKNVTNAVTFIGATSDFDATRITSAAPRTIGVHAIAHF